MIWNFLILSEILNFRVLIIPLFIEMARKQGTVII